MNRTRGFAALALLFCGGATAAVSASTPAALPQAMGLVSGRWHTVLTIKSAEMQPVPRHEAVPQAAATALKARVGTTFATDDCIGSPPADGSLILPGIRIEAGCLYDAAAAQGGRMHLKAHCGKVAEGFRADFTVDGHYTPTGMDAVLETTTVSPRVGYIVHMIIGTQSRRAGECPAQR